MKAPKNLDLLYLIKETGLSLTKIAKLSGLTLPHFKYRFSYSEGKQASCLIELKASLQLMKQQIDLIIKLVDGKLLQAERKPDSKGILPDGEDSSSE